MASLSMKNLRPACPDVDLVRVGSDLRGHRARRIAGTRRDGASSIEMLLPGFQPQQEFAPVVALPSSNISTMATPLQSLAVADFPVALSVRRDGIPRCGSVRVSAQGQCSLLRIRQQPQLDSRSLHAGAPVVEGEKWAVTKWFRERRFVTAAGSNHGVPPQ